MANRIHIFFFVVLFSMSTWGQTPPRGEMMGAKAYLESLIVKGYSRELSTRVAIDEFQISARVTVKKSESKKTDDERVPINDIDLSFIDPEVLYKSYSQESDGSQSFFSDIVVTKVELTLGLKSTLGEVTTKEIKDWFEKRVKEEFGSLGSSELQTIRLPVDSAGSVNKSWWDQVKELQQLTGLALLAVSILMAMLIWSLLSGRGAKSGGSDIKINNSVEGGKDSNRDNEKPIATTSHAKEDDSALKKYSRITVQLEELLPKVMNDLENVIKEWCQTGDAGISQVAILAEIGGKIVGRLPIPNEYRDQVAETFKSMQAAEIDDKLSILQSVYWDLLATLNLGSQSLHVPFSFMSSATIGSVSEVLMDNNARMKTIVAMFMNEGQRGDYVRSLNPENKIELLTMAAELSEISENELIKMENELAPLFTTPKTERSISLSSSLGKIINGLTPIEACTLVTEIKGPAMRDFKKSSPSLAFLNEWPDKDLSLLMRVSSTEELATYLRIRPDLESRIMELVPPMAKAILQDDMKKPSTLSEQDQGKLLLSMLKKIEDLVAKGEINLSSIFVETLEENQRSEAA
jgi:flagellar motor switch protein FliG